MLKDSGLQFDFLYYQQIFIQWNCSQDAVDGYVESE